VILVSKPRDPCTPCATGRLLRLCAALAVAVLALASCGEAGPASDGSSGTPAASQTPTAPDRTASPSGPQCQDPTRAAGIYYVGDVPGVGPRLYREFHRVGTCQDPITEALTHMFTVAPGDPDYFSPWDPSTRVLSVSTSGTDAVVDLSDFPRLGSAYEAAAVEQLIWTATAADKDVRQVRLLVDGGEPPAGHVDLSDPLPRGDALTTRANVWILAPLQGSEVSSPVTVSVHGTGWEGVVPLIVYRGGTEVAATQVTTQMGGFAEAGTTIDLPPGDYRIEAYNDNGMDASLQLWDTKDFSVG
jgi:hypothetical protein